MTKRKNQRNKKNNIDIVEIRVRRFIAIVIDWYLTNMLAVIPITFYLRGNDYLKPHMLDLTYYDFHIGLGLGIYGILMGIVYYVLVPVYLFNGQTLGKKICKIKVVKENLDSVNLKDMLVRELLGASLLEGGLIIIPTYIRKLLMLTNFAFAVTPLKYVAYVLTFCSIGYAYFQKKTQCFHDKVAKTIVVKI